MSVLAVFMRPACPGWRADQGGGASARCRRRLGRAGRQRVGATGGEGPKGLSWRVATLRPFASEPRLLEQAGLVAHRADNLCVVERLQLRVPHPNDPPPARSTRRSRRPCAPADTQTFTYGTGPGITPYSVSATSTTDFIWNTVPIAGDFTNQGASLPDTNQIVQSPISISIDNAPATKTLSIDLDTNISYVGATSLTSTLNLDNFLSGALQPIQLFYSGVSAIEACCNANSSPFFIQNGETFANAVAILDSQGNPAADGYYRQ